MRRVARVLISYIELDASKGDFLSDNFRILIFFSSDKTKHRAVECNPKKTHVQQIYKQV